MVDDVKCACGDKRRKRTIIGKADRRLNVERPPINVGLPPSEEALHVLHRLDASSKRRPSVWRCRHARRLKLFHNLLKVLLCLLRSLSGCLACVRLRARPLRPSRPPRVTDISTFLVL